MVNRRRIPLPPRLLRKGEAAGYCGVSESHWDKLVKAGAAPGPVNVGGTVERWDIRALDQWIDDLGQPARDSFATVE